MPFLFMAFIVIQLLLAIHVVREGHDRYWVFIILLLPGIGCAMYFIMVLIPEIMRSRSTAKAIHSVKSRVNPQGTLKLLKEDLLISETSQNFLAVANEYHRLGEYQPAIEYYQKALSGIFIGDPDISFQLAEAQFAAGEMQACVQTLDSIHYGNPRFKSQEIHLLCCRALAAAGDIVRAEEEFLQLIAYYTGPQARYFYASLLRAENRPQEAAAQLETVLLVARRSKPHYRKYHKQYLRQSRSELKALAKK